MISTHNLLTPSANWIGNSLSNLLQAKAQKKLLLPFSSGATPSKSLIDFLKQFDEAKLPMEDAPLI